MSPSVAAARQHGTPMCNSKYGSRDGVITHLACTASRAIASLHSSSAPGRPWVNWRRENRRIRSGKPVLFVGSSLTFARYPPRDGIAWRSADARLLVMEPDDASNAWPRVPPLRISGTHASIAPASISASAVLPFDPGNYTRNDARPRRSISRGPSRPNAAWPMGCVLSDESMICELKGHARGDDFAGSTHPRERLENLRMFGVSHLVLRTNIPCARLAMHIYAKRVTRWIHPVGDYPTHTKQ
jgi:hypothetical protein